MGKTLEFEYFTLEELEKRRNESHSVWDTALYNFCKYFAESWRAFRYKNHALVQYSFQPHTPRYVTVHVRIGVRMYAQSFEWLHTSQPLESAGLALRAAPLLMQRIQADIAQIGLRAVTAQPIYPRRTYFTAWTPREYFDKILTGELSAIPTDATAQCEIKRGDILRIYCSMYDAMVFRDTPDQKTYESVDVVYIGSARGIVCFEPLKVDVHGR